MILHLIHDDKVVPRMIAQFEEINPGKNVFLCIKRKKDGDTLQFLKNNPLVTLSGSVEEKKINWNDINKVCIHYLTYSKIRYYWKLCLKHKLRNKLIIWFMWGGDVYDMLERKGLQLYSKENSFIRLSKPKVLATDKVSKGISNFIQRIRNKRDDYVKSYFLDKKTDYLVLNSKDEYNLFCKYLSFSNCKELLKYNYYPIEDVLGSLVDEKIKGNAIIVGNSASESNNHEYVLNFLKDIDISSRKVYVPLSYGDNAEYAQIVSEKYSSLPNSVIIKNFMPLDEYHQLLKGCSTFIYGNFRQEAWGNIMVALYLGGKVYVSEKSIMPAFLSSLGYKFFITEDIRNTFNIELTEQEKEENRKIVIRNHSRDKNRKDIKYICNL